MKKCELCNSPARLHCESDQASLCLECDAKVHGANFIVTKHPRCLLCHVCQSPTPWHGSGPKFLPTISVCSGCISDSNEAYNDDDDDEDDSDDTENDDISDGDDGWEEDEEENQVVPWTSTPPPPPVSSSSNSSGCSNINSDEGFSD